MVPYIYISVTEYSQYYRCRSNQTEYAGKIAIGEAMHYLYILSIPPGRLEFVEHFENTFLL